MAKEKKGVRLDHVSKIYQDPKTGKDFYAVHDANTQHRARRVRYAARPVRLRQDHHRCA